MRSVSSHELWCDKLSLSRLTLPYTAARWSADYEVGKYWTLSNSSPLRVWSAANYVSHIMVEEVRPISVTSTELHSPDPPWGGSGLSPLLSLLKQSRQPWSSGCIRLSTDHTGLDRWEAESGSRLWVCSLFPIDIFLCADLYYPICRLSFLLWKYIQIYFKYITCYIVQLIGTY